ncbi:MAG TPA: hypothetical protein VEF89_00445 [Solirubrobacteraceae bacterium]|nr:hypothetical protein [Solirubrobacteraceae bacterium]
MNVTAHEYVGVSVPDDPSMMSSTTEAIGRIDALGLIVGEGVRP